MYNYLIVGAGLFSSVFANQMIEKGKKYLVINICSHVVGNICSWENEGIQVHMCGPHIFHALDR